MDIRTLILLENRKDRKTLYRISFLIYSYYSGTAVSDSNNLDTIILRMGALLEKGELISKNF